VSHPHWHSGSVLLTADLKKRYEATRYARGEPLEGFRFERPPVFAALRSGPFHAFGIESAEEPALEQMAVEAAALAKEGKLTVSMLVVTSRSLRTQEGIGVGSTYAEARKAHDALVAFPFSALWEDISCIAKPHAKSHIHFFFESCSLTAPPSPDYTIRGDASIIRVVIGDLDTAESAR